MRKYIPEIDFGNVMYEKNEGINCRVLSLCEVRPKVFAKYVSDVAAAGYICLERHNLGTGSFYAFRRRELVLFLSYYPELGQMRIVAELQSGYDQLKDRLGGWQLPSLITQLDLAEFGMAYLIRLSDGRFLILDGGCESDAERLMRQLKAQSPEEKPVIAAWIFTNEKENHKGCFRAFYERYKEDVMIQAIFYNWGESAEELSVGTETFVLRPHTGQGYQIGNARIEVLASADDVPEETKDVSLVLRVQMEGQNILFCSDARLQEATLAERYGTYLKSDLLQVTNHGLGGGTVKAYNLISPEVCLVPATEAAFYGYEGCYYEENKTLIYGLDVKEIMTGSHGDLTLTLPYKAKPNGRHLLLETAKEWKKKLGACSWIFGDLTGADDEFSILNATAFEGSVRVEFYFEDSKAESQSLEFKIPAGRIRKVKLGLELEMQGKDSFGVHFLTDRPLVIWGKAKPIYVQ